jgi:hypothetical protein
VVGLRAARAYASVDGGRGAWGCAAVASLRLLLGSPRSRADGEMVRPPRGPGRRLRWIARASADAGRAPPRWFLMRLAARSPFATIDSLWSIGRPTGGSRRCRTTRSPCTRAAAPATRDRGASLANCGLLAAGHRFDARSLGASPRLPALRRAGGDGGPLPGPRDPWTDLRVLSTVTRGLWASEGKSGKHGANGVRRSRSAATWTRRAGGPFAASSTSSKPATSLGGLG